MQAGSTIMPGKVNPVVPEMTMQCAMKAIAGDTAVTAAAAHGEFELNAFLPLIADTLLENLELLERAVTIFRTKCIDTLTADAARCAAILDRSYAFAASYVPILGYDAVDRIISESGGDPARAKRALDEAAEKII
jgi:aspartate ammonia-lyase